MFPKSKEDAERRSYEFWSTQPVPKIDEDITANEAIEEDTPHDQLRKEPYSLPSGFQWDTLNLDDPCVVSIFSLSLMWMKIDSNGITARAGVWRVLKIFLFVGDS
jgi:hypothetical protein